MSLKFLIPVLSFGFLFLVACQPDKYTPINGTPLSSAFDTNDSLVQTTDSSNIDSLRCASSALAMDKFTLYMEEFEGNPAQGLIVEGVCGKALVLAPGEHVSLDIELNDPMPAGTIEFWFKPGKGFFDVSARTLLGNNGSRAHFFVKNGNLIFQKNHDGSHYYVSAPVILDSTWNLIAGQWGDGYLSIFLNGHLLLSKPHKYGYKPSTRVGIDNNRIIIGSKSACCMEALGQYDSMVTSGAFDQVRISNVARYKN